MIGILAVNLMDVRQPQSTNTSPQAWQHASLGRKYNHKVHEQKPYMQLFLFQSLPILSLVRFGPSLCGPSTAANAACSNAVPSSDPIATYLVFPSRPQMSVSSGHPRQQGLSGENLVQDDDDVEDDERRWYVSELPA
jgi:hypothetical protein